MSTSKQDKQNDKLLAGLERRYEPELQYRAKARKAFDDIRQLLEDKYIDRAHADILREAVKEQFRKDKAKHTSKIDAQRRRREEDEARTPALVVILIMVILFALMLHSCFG